MVTRFGMFCRNIRMQNGKLLYEMARQLDVTPAFLSRVENGKAKPPIGWEDTIISNYDLTEEQKLELEESIQEAREKKVIKIDSLKSDEQDMMFAFARKLDGMDEEEKNKWKKMLNIE